MKIVFIDPTQTIINYGLRALAQFLINKGHEVKIIFLNQSFIKYDLQYPETIINDLFKIVEDSDIIGFSFVSNYLGQAESLTKKLKDKFDIPVIWGGIHAIAAPEKSMEIADFVCVGEGESCIHSLIQKMENGENLNTVPGLWFSDGENKTKNPAAELNPDVDSYSMPMYNNLMEFVRRENRIVQMTDEIRKEITGVPTNYYNIKGNSTYPYLTLASRGCPNSCTYCCNNLFKKIYSGKGKLLRRRSNREIIRELEIMIQKMPYINLIEFFDDDFIFADNETIIEFAEFYKEKIGLPFRCNFRPESVTEEKISALSNAGLVSVEMGLQSASQKTNKLFKRHFNKDSFLKAAEIVSQFENIIAHYDIIVDNPFENYEDIQQTLRFISNLPEPYKIAVYSLTFFPGTFLYEYAKNKGLINDEIKDIISKKNYVQYEFKQPYIKFLLMYIRNVGFKNPWKKRIFNFLTNIASLKIFGSFVFYPLWFSILFGKRFASWITNRDVKLIPG